MASSPRSSSLPSLLHSIPLLLLGGLLLVAGCDSSVDLQQDDADPTARTVPADSSALALAPMPTGSELLTPGEPAPKNNADASAYGCYLASRPYSDEVAFHSRYLHFPEALHERAEGGTRQVTHRVHISTEATPVSSGVRYMNCTIPNVDEAETLVREQILEIGLETAAHWVVEQSDQAQRKSTCFEVIQISSACMLGHCNVETHIIDIVCTGSGGTNGVGGDGSEGTPWPGGDQPSDGDSPDDGGGTPDETCTEINPPPGSDCDPVQKEVPQVEDFNAEVDTVDIQELPDCSDSTGANELGESDIPPSAWEDYCESSLPTDTQRQRIEEALDRIEDRGTVCAQMAQRARIYLNNDLIYIDPTPDRAGGWGYDGLVIIWSDYVDRYHDDRTKKDDGYARDGNLDSILAHEFDHVLGAEGHVPGTFNTIHQRQCSNLMN